LVDSNRAIADRPYKHPHNQSGIGDPGIARKITRASLTKNARDVSKETSMFRASQSEERPQLQWADNRFAQHKLFYFFLLRALLGKVIYETLKHKIASG